MPLSALNMDLKYGKNAHKFWEKHFISCRYSKLTWLVFRQLPHIHQHKVYKSTTTVYYTYMGLHKVWASDIL